MTQCRSHVRGEVVRLTRLDACGAPVSGPASTVTSEGFVTVEISFEYEEPTEYKLKGANDKFIVNERGRPLLKWATTNITMGEVDPDLFNLATGMPLVLNDAVTPEAIGFRLREEVYGDFALELWTKLNESECIEGLQAYGYTLFPWIVDASIGNYTVGNEVISFPINQGRTKKGSQWGVGPYDVDTKLTGTPGPSPLLTAIGPLDHMDMHITTLAPPTPTCGAVALA